MKKVHMVVTTTCSVCKMLKPMIDKVVGSSKCELVIEYADSDAVTPVICDLLTEMNIKSVPAFFFMQGTKLVSTHFGAISMPDLKKKVTELENYVA
ncbi:MAG: thioredoxin family protein [Clostridia bacterium]|nr:thioredoxin family protein [Clostridia bacterium]